MTEAITLMLSLQSLIICWKAMWMPSSWQNALEQVLGGLGNCREGSTCQRIVHHAYQSVHRDAQCPQWKLESFWNHVFCFDWS